MIRALRWIVTLALRWGGVTAAERTVRVATSALPDVNRAQTQVFNISGPTTVYVRGSHCRVTVKRGEAQNGFGRRHEASPVYCNRASSTKNAATALRKVCARRLTNRQC